MLYATGKLYHKTKSLQASDSKPKNKVIHNVKSDVVSDHVAGKRKIRYSTVSHYMA